ncbi:MAG: carboxypeptidase-like regulatory domain-containing protein, partial [Pyrinomonadaceae bacterium]
MKELSMKLNISKTLCRSRGLGICILLIALFSIPAAAQITTATIVGTISDPGGAQVPAASVTARNVDTGLKRTVVSSNDGDYRIEFLPVGNYVLEVTAASGFKKAYRDGIVLRVNDTARIDVALEVGNVAEVVTVSTAPP